MESMERIIKAKQEHRDISLKAFRRMGEALPGCKDEGSFIDALESGSLFVIEESKRISGYAIVTKSIQEALFGSGHEASSRSFDLLEEIGLDEENIILVQAFGIDPAFPYQIEAKKLFDFLSSRYGKPVMVFWMGKELKTNQIEFLKRIGVKEFKPSFEFSGRLFYKRFEQEGLARGFAW